MAKTILVPVDGSALSERAVGYASVLAGRLAANVVLMRAVLTIKPHSADDERFNAEAIQEAEAELQKLAATCSAQAVSGETVVWHDEAGWAIVEAARQRHADLIVMSTHGRSGLGRWLYGSVADRVLRSADSPIILLPPGARNDWSLAAPFRMVIAVDGSEFAEQAVEPATELAKAMGAEVRLVAAVDPPYYWVGPEAYAVYDPAVERDAAQEYADSIAARMGKHGVTTTVEVTWGTPDRVILESARQTESHLIVLATHGRGGLARLAMGSVTQAVLHRSTLPIMILRPAGVREKARTEEVPIAMPAAPLAAVAMSPFDVTVAQRALAHFLENDSPTDDERRAAGGLIERLGNVFAFAAVS